MQRRSFVKNMGAAASAIASGISTAAACVPASSQNGLIKHSVCRWTFDHLSVEQLCKHAKALGLSGIDLVGPADWMMLRKYELHSTMCNGAEPNITDGFCDPKFHGLLQQNYSAMIPKVAEAGYQNLICFTGNRRGISDAAGLENCVRALTPLVQLAEQYKVVLQLELFNSRIDHPDYMADKSGWGIALCERLNSPSFKLLYDIYHMQINEGDIIRSIQKNGNWFGHYHVAGNPGRHEPFGLQEIHYPSVMKAIAASGFTGYVAQEFLNTGTTPEAKLNNLRLAVQECTIS